MKYYTLLFMGVILFISCDKKLKTSNTTSIDNIQNDSILVAMDTTHYPITYKVEGNYIFDRSEWSIIKSNDSLLQGTGTIIFYSKDSIFFDAMQIQGCPHIKFPFTQKLNEQGIYYDSVSDNYQKKIYCKNDSIIYETTRLCACGHIYFYLKIMGKLKVN